MMEAQLNDPTDILLSEQITRDYRIVRRLGRGGMGEVYLAEQLRVGKRLVALKVLNHFYEENPQIIKRFEAEAATAGLIHHRNVVTIYESRMTDDGHIYVAMEYIDGRTLREVIAEEGRLPLDEVVEITRQICAGLAAAHKLGVVHRDIKPDNIMLARDEDGLTIKVLDFGIARLSEAQSFNVHTQPGLVLGTPAYMSPEQAAGAIGDRIDARSDIYSLGMVVYEMLTGRVAFANESWMAILHQHLYDPPALPSQLCESAAIPPVIDQVVMHALAKDRLKRPQNAMEFARELEAAYRTTLSVEPPARGGESPLTPPEPLSEDFATTKLPSPVPTHQVGARTDGRPDRSRFTIGKQMGLALFALTVCLLAGWLIWKTMGSDAGPAPVAAALPANPTPVVLEDLLSYRITREKPIAKLTTLPLDQTVRSGEDLSFDFKLSQPGALYLLREDEDKTWRWMDAVPSGRAPGRDAGEWISIPKEHYYYYTPDDRLGEERFWVLLVPDRIQWALAEAIAPSRIVMSREEKLAGTAMIEAEAAARLQTWLEEKAVRLEPKGEQSDDAVVFRLRQPAGSHQVAYHRITLNHIARE